MRAIWCPRVRRQYRYYFLAWGRFIIGRRSSIVASTPVGCDVIVLIPSSFFVIALFLHSSLAQSAMTVGGGDPNAAPRMSTVKVHAVLIDDRDAAAVMLSMTTMSPDIAE